MDSEDQRRFSGKVYSRRNRKTDKKHFSPANAAGITAPAGTKVSESAEQPEKVVAQTQDLLTANSTSGYVPDGVVGMREEVDNGGDGGGGVEMGEGRVRPMISQVEDRVRINLNEARSRVEIRNFRRTLEGELDHIRSLVKRIEVKENNCKIVLVPGRGNISCRYPRFTVTNHMNNHLPLVRPNLPSLHPLNLAPIANHNPVVEREKRIRKANNYYNNSDFLLGNDKLPSEFNKKAKINKNARRPLPLMSDQFVPYHAPRHVPQARILERSTSITRAADPKKEKPSIFPQVGRTPIPKKTNTKDPKKRDMTTEEIHKLIGDLENLPPEQLGAVGQIIKKRGIPIKQNNDELELDIDSVDAETLWELDMFVTNYKKSRNSKSNAEVAVQARATAARNAPITISSGPMVAAAALKESRNGEVHTSASSTHVEGADNARSSSSDSGSSSSDSDSDSSS